jgi:GrpB-like predicted nucleotidyltransferase (UPF0157 family)
VSRPIRVVDPDPRWPVEFDVIANVLWRAAGPEVRRIDHIGSTAVPGLAAKDIIDIQITVTDLALTAAWPSELLPGVARREGIVADHVPPRGSDDPAEWAKAYWSDSDRLHVHVREAGRANQRYALLFRDYLRSDPVARDAYGLTKRALSDLVHGDVDRYYAVKDPACDLIIAGAEQWAARVGWQP